MVGHLDQYPKQHRLTTISVVGLHLQSMWGSRELCTAAGQVGRQRGEWSEKCHPVVQSVLTHHPHTAYPHSTQAASCPWRSPVNLSKHGTLPRGAAGAGGCTPQICPPCSLGVETRNDSGNHLLVLRRNMGEEQKGRLLQPLL